MALGRVIFEMFEGLGPFFSGIGEIAADLLPEVAKVIGELLGGDKILVGIAALSIPLLIWMIRRRRSKPQREPVPPGPVIPAMILGLTFGLASLGSLYVFWRINHGGYIEETRMTAIAPAICVPVVLSLFFLRSNSSQKASLALVAFGVGLTVAFCLADFKVLT